MKQESKNKSNKLYVHTISADICNYLEELLDEYDITVPSEDREGEEGEARIYGGVYSDLEENVTNVLATLCETVKENPEISINGDGIDELSPISEKKELQVRKFAVVICGLFEDLLNEHDITIPSNDREGEEDEGRIFGDIYYGLEDEITEILAGLCLEIKASPDITINTKDYNGFVDEKDNETLYNYRETYRLRAVPKDKIMIAVLDDGYYAEKSSYPPCFDSDLPYTAFVLDTPEEFIKKWYEINDGAWYWVFNKGELICSGAVDPNDIEIFEEHFNMSFEEPELDVALEETRNCDSSWVLQQKTEYIEPELATSIEETACEVVSQYDWTMPKYNSDEYSDYNDYDSDCLDIGHERRSEICCAVIKRLVEKGKIPEGDESYYEVIDETVWDEITNCICKNQDERTVDKVIEKAKKRTENIGEKRSQEQELEYEE